MGPLASAEFLRTLYEENLREQEQAMPACILYSDPSIPDRTEAIERGEEGPVVARLEEALAHLADCGAERLVMACVTAHHFLPAIRADLRARVISLVDVVIDDVRRSGARHLMFCTNGTRRTGIFERSPRWGEVEGLVVWPDEKDQRAVHELLYRVKQGDVGADRRGDVERLLARYDAAGLVAGCTEMHLLTKRMGNGGGGPLIADPLLTVARRVSALLEEAEPARAEAAERPARWGRPR